MISKLLKIEEKLDSVFGLHFLGQFFNSGLESVPVVDDDEDELDEFEEENASNQIFLGGYICKEAVYRKTPLGREIADLLIAVNRSYGKSDYISCICWGRNARFASTFEVGTHVEIWGRIQSREYVKRINDDEVEQRIAYEVSVSKIETPE